MINLELSSMPLKSESVHSYNLSERALVSVNFNIWNFEYFKTRNKNNGVAEMKICTAIFGFLLFSATKQAKLRNMAKLRLNFFFIQFYKIF